MVSTHGIGGPSSAIVFEELYRLGARSVVRLGTCREMTKKLNTGDFVVPTGAAHSNGSLNTYVSDRMLPAVPDFDLTAAVINECRTQGIMFHTGLVFSSDAFYNEDRNFLKNWAKRGVVAVDMECATLFTLRLLRGFRTAALLMVCDSFAKKTKEFGTADMLEKETENAASIVFNSLSGK